MGEGSFAPNDDQVRNFIEPAVASTTAPLLGLHRPISQFIEFMAF